MKPGMYRVSDDVPGSAELIHTPNDMVDGARLWVTSYALNEPDGSGGTRRKTYVAGAYAGVGGKRRFFVFPSTRANQEKWTWLISWRRALMRLPAIRAPLIPGGTAATPTRHDYAAPQNPPPLVLQNKGAGAPVLQDSGFPCD